MRQARQIATAVARILACGLLVAGCTLIAPLYAHRLTAIGNGTVTIDDPNNVVESVTADASMPPSDTLVAVSNPDGDGYRLDIAWASAACAPGGSFRLSNAEGQWVLEAISLSGSPVSMPSGSDSCLGGVVGFGAELSLRQRIEAGAVVVHDPQ